MMEENVSQGSDQGDRPAPLNQPSSEPDPPFASREMERSTHLLRVLEELFSSRADPDTLQASLFERLCDIFNVSVGLLFLWDQDGKDWHVRAHRGMPRDFGKNGQISRAWQSLPTIVVQEGGELFAGDLSKDSRFIGQIIKSYRIKSFAGVALKSHEKILGVLGLGFNESSWIIPAEEEALRRAASLAGLFLDRQPEGAPRASLPQPETQDVTEIREPGEITGGAPPGTSMGWTTTLDGRILSADPETIRFLGYSRDQLIKMNLSDLISKKSAQHLLQNKGKREANGERPAPLPEVELHRPGRGGTTVSVKVSRFRHHGRPALKFIVQHVTTPAKIEDELQQRTREVEILKSLLDTLGQDYTMEGLLLSLLNKVLDLLEFEGGEILHFDERKRRLFLSAQKGASAESVHRLTTQGLRQGEGIAGRVMKSGEPYFVTAQERQGTLKKKLVGEEGLRSYACVPIPFQGQVWGTLSVFSASMTLDREGLRWLGETACALGRAIEGARVLEEVRRLVVDLSLMNEVSQSISRSLHLEVLLGTVVESFTKVVNASNCFIMLIDDKRNVLYGVAASGRYNAAFKKSEIKMGDNSLAVLAVKERRPFAVENVSKDHRTNKKMAEQFKQKSLLTVPLITKEKVIGAVIVDETRYYRIFSEEEVKRATTLADQVAVAIENAILYQAVTKHIERLQTLSSAIVNIQEEERRRIARELHDETGRTLTSIKGDLETIEKEVVRLGGASSDQIVERLTGIKTQVAKTVAELQRLSYELRPAILDEQGLVSTLRWHVEDFSKRTGIVVHLQANDHQKRFPPKIETLFYRIVQEALTNVAKHAQAESVVINLERKDLLTSLYITDDGKGFDVKRYFSSTPGLRRGLGILGMKERVELSGGTFFIDSEPGEGTRISIRVPLMKRS